MKKKFILIVYDISDDRRRTRLHTLLLNYGSPVQYSVFECLLTENELGKMKKAIRGVIRPKKDNLRYYTLCENCLQKVETTMGKSVLSEHPQPLIA